MYSDNSAVYEILCKYIYLVSLFLQTSDTLIRLREWGSLCGPAIRLKFPSFSVFTETACYAPNFETV